MYYVQAMIGFKQDSKLPTPHPEFDSERVRYEHRFAPFSGMMTPPPVQYTEFKVLLNVVVLQKLL